jgi:hypothetical protein
VLLLVKLLEQDQLTSHSAATMNGLALPIPEEFLRSLEELIRRALVDALRRSDERLVMGS